VRTRISRSKARRKYTAYGDRVDDASRPRNNGIEDERCSWRPPSLLGSLHSTCGVDHLLDSGLMIIPKISTTMGRGAAVDIGFESPRGSVIEKAGEICEYSGLFTVREVEPPSKPRSPANRPQTYQRRIYRATDVSTH